MTNTKQGTAVDGAIGIIEQAARLMDNLDQVDYYLMLCHAVEHLRGTQALGSVKLKANVTV